MIKEEKEFCPYCGSKKIIMLKFQPGILIDPAPTIVGGIKSIIHKRYKCENCGKDFD